jgi:hypothetical protein
MNTPAMQKIREIILKIDHKAVHDFRDEIVGLCDEALAILSTIEQPEHEAITGAKQCLPQRDMGEDEKTQDRKLVQEAVETLQPLVDRWEFSSEITFAIKTLITAATLHQITFNGQDVVVYQGHVYTRLTDPAATQQVEEVTVDDIAELLHVDKCENLIGDMDLIADRYPNGLKIVKETQ